jgi:gliding motility-associated-like protein
MNQLKIALCLIVSMRFVFGGFAQNLVPNPSFEDNSGCPTSFAQIDLVDFWTTPTNHPGTPDYFNTCSTSPTSSIPVNSVGTEPAHSGNAYTGLRIHFGTVFFPVEYLQAQLISPLTAGVTYDVSCYYSLGEASGFIIDNFGIHFSSAPINGLGGGIIAPMPATPQLTTSSFLDNENGWTQLTWTYTANGGEEYITVGNFSALGTYPVNPHTGSANVSYVFLDDFSIEPESCVIDLGNDTTLCEGEVLSIGDSLSNLSYQWQDGSTSPFLDVTQSGTYWVEASGVTCSFTDSITVNFEPIPGTVDLGTDITLCPGESELLDATVANADAYLWQDGSTNATFEVNQEGIYTVEVSNSCGQSTAGIEVEFIPSLVLDLGDDIELCNDETVLLDASSNLSSNVNYVWQDNSTTSTYIVSQPGTYTVEVSNSCESQTDAINVETIYCSCELHVPNSFTPDNNDSNDQFKTIFSCELSNYQLLIYNRWGEVLYESFDPNSTWDGTYGGKRVEQGVYIYTIKYAFQEDESPREVKGHLTVLY